MNKCIARSSWSVINHGANFSTLQIRTKDNRIIQIHNVYNPCQTSGDNSVLGKIRKVLQKTRDNVENILLGDFNLHYPLWGGGAGVEVDEEAETLIMMTEEAHLKQVSPPGTITWQRHKSKNTLDLIFLSPLLFDSLLACRKSSLSDTHSDHKPIRTVISLSTIQAEKRQIRNWGKTNIPTLRQTLDHDLQNSPALYPPINKT